MTTTEESAPSQVTDRIQRITMPKWGLSMESGKVTDWFVAEGDELTEGQDICEIDTDKIAGALESTWSGTVRALVVDTMVDVPGAAPSPCSPTPTFRRRRSTRPWRRPGINWPPATSSTTPAPSWPRCRSVT